MNLFTGNGWRSSHFSIICSTRQRGADIATIVVPLSGMSIVPGNIAYYTRPISYWIPKVAINLVNLWIE
jgi:hypothetical protein